MARSSYQHRYRSVNQVALGETGLLDCIPRWISVLSLFAARVSRSPRLAADGAEWICADQRVDILLDELVTLVRKKLVALVCVRLVGRPTSAATFYLSSMRCSASPPDPCASFTLFAAILG
jgi:hypothetical protein